jgi:hypothetical protein
VRRSYGLEFESLAFAGKPCGAEHVAALSYKQKILSAGRKRLFSSEKHRWN